MWSEQTNRARETAKKKKRSTCWKTAGDFVIRSWNLPFLHHFVHTTVKSVNASHNYMLQSTITYNKMIRYSQLTNPLNTCRLQHTCLEASTDPEDLDQQDRHWLLINIMLKRITIDSLQYLFTSTTVQWQPLILCWNESLTRPHWLHIVSMVGNSCDLCVTFVFIILSDCFFYRQKWNKRCYLILLFKKKKKNV